MGRLDAKVGWEGCVERMDVNVRWKGLVGR